MFMTAYPSFIGEEHLSIDTKAFCYGDKTVTVDKDGNN
jgi:hypothetical protein